MSAPTVTQPYDNGRVNTQRTTGAQALQPAAGGGPARGPEAPLGTYANNSSPAGQSGTAVDPEVTHRAVRYATRRVLWKQSSLARVRDCGQRSTEEDGAVGVKVTSTAEGGNVAGFRGTTSCGSVWACPVCSAKVAAHRAQELAQAVEWYTSRGYSVYMLTLTMRHNLGHSLDDCWSALSYGWDKVNSGKQWIADKDMWGIDGWNRVTETTHGDENGWHVHAHVVMFFNREVGMETVRFVGQRMYQRWEKALRRKGFDAVEEHGLDIRKADEAVADYLAKTTYAEDPKLQAAAEAYRQANKASAKKLAGEAALGVFKEARRGNRTPFKILDSIIAGKRAGLDTTKDERIWHEWEQSSRGRKQMQWSQFKGPDGLKLRDRVGLNDEKKDEEVTEEDQLKGEVVAWLPKATWNVVKWEAEFLLQAFDHSAEAGIAYLRQRHLLVTDARGDASPGGIP